MDADVNNNTLLNKEQNRIIEKNYPAFSEERKIIRENWNIVRNHYVKIPWELYLLHCAIEKEYNISEFNNFKNNY